jgi:acyl carrier protein
MSDNTSGLHGTIKQFILEEFLPGENPNTLTETTPLITGGVLDSISTLRLVNFLETTYGVTFEAHEMTADHLDTLNDIARLVQEKAGTK